MPTRYQAAIYPIRHDNAATVSAERAANIAGGPPELAANGHRKESAAKQKPLGID